MARETEYPEVYQARTLLYASETSTRYEDVAHFQLIHEVLEWAQQQNPDRNFAAMDPSSPIFAERQEWGKRMDPRIDDVSGFRGLSLWGDSGPCFDTGDSLFMFLWSFLAVAEMARRWIVCFPQRLVCNCGCKGRHTFDSVLRVIVWDCRICASGTPPQARHDGVAMADSTCRGDKARAKRGANAASQPLPKECVLAKKGEWAWLKQVIGLQGWRASGILARMCYVCMASWGGTNNALGNTLGAAWRSTMGMRHVDYTEHMRRENHGWVSELFNIPGFRYWMIVMDLMHFGELGIVLPLLGNIMLEVFREVFREVGGSDHQPRPDVGPAADVDPPC